MWTTQAFDKERKKGGGLTFTRISSTIHYSFIHNGRFTGLGQDAIWDHFAAFFMAENCLADNLRGLYLENMLLPSSLLIRWYSMKRRQLTRKIQLEGSICLSRFAHLFHKPNPCPCHTCGRILIHWEPNTDLDPQLQYLGQKMTQIGKSSMYWAPSTPQECQEPSKAEKSG